jgi:hypothetical protein
VLVAILSEGQPGAYAGIGQVEAAARAAVSAVTGGRARSPRGAPEGCDLGAPPAGQTGTTTVRTILSARVCRLASHSGNRKPM